MTCSAAGLPTVIPEQYIVPDFVRTFRAMACDVTVRISGGGTDDPQDAFDGVVGVFAQVERECTRFDEHSDLMRANAAGSSWYGVGDYCFAAITEAARAHERTAGLFDPRVLSSLTALGYDQSLAFEAGPVELRGHAGSRSGPAATPWQPGLDSDLGAVRIGPVPIDLGGIGKGLTVRWAAEGLSRRCGTFFIEAGGDGYFGGTGPAGAGWQVGVEDPLGGPTPVAVVSVSDLACATSSIRVRRWRVDGRPAHHLIDPRTGEPAVGGLLSVSVIATDPATAEIWSKVLFLHGREGIAEASAAENLAAIWVDDRGNLGVNPAAERYVIWRAA